MRSYLLLFAGCVAFHLIGTWTLPLIDRDEPRFAEASREMGERRNYVVPYFNGQYRFDKPPLTYWAQLASYRIFGENDFAARFPSVIAASLTALLIFAWGSRINLAKTAGGAPALQRRSVSRIGLWAAIIFTLSLQTFIHAKAAVADMWLVFFMTVAFWAGWEMGSDSSKRRPPNSERRTPNWKWSWIYFCSLALAFLAKGPIGWIPLIPAVWLLIRHHRTSVAGVVAFIGGIMLMLGLICLWAVPALIQTHGEFFRIGIGRHVVGRSVGAMEGHGAKSFGLYLLLLPFYFLTVFVSFFPWSIKLPWLIGKIRAQRDELDSYLLCGVVSVFGIFTLVATKLPHYILPAIPLLALLLAKQWSIAVDSELEGRASRAFKFSAAAAAIIWIAVALILPPVVAHSFPSFALFEESRDLLRPDMEMVSVEYAEPSLVWYFRSRVKGYLRTTRKNNLSELMTKAGSRLVFLPTSEARDPLAQSGPQWKSFSTHGFNIPKGKQIDLSVLVKSED